VEYYKGVLDAYLAAPPAVRAAVDQLCHPCPLDESGNACRRSGSELKKSRRDPMIRLEASEAAPTPVSIVSCYSREHTAVGCR